MTNKEIVSILLGVKSDKSLDPRQGGAHCISRVRMHVGGSSMVKGNSGCLEAGRLRFKSGPFWLLVYACKKSPELSELQLLHL